MLENMAEETSRQRSAEYSLHNGIRQKLQALEGLSKVEDLVLISRICTSLSEHPPQTQLLDAALGSD